MVTQQDDVSTVAQTTIALDSVKALGQKIDPQVYYAEELHIDTTAYGYDISYQILNTDKAFNPNKEVARGETQLYAERKIVLTIKKDGAFILNSKVFYKTYFESIIPSPPLEQLLLYNGDIEHICAEYVKIYVNTNVPETDWSYDIWLTVHNDGEVHITCKEVIMEEEW